MRVGSVLLICSGNTCRSPMAAALLRELWARAGSPWPMAVSSAGTGAYPGMGATDHAVKVMQRRSIDIGGHRSAPVDDDSIANADLILVMTQRHKEYLRGIWPEVRDRVFTIGEYAGNMSEVPDPFGGSIQHYEATARTLEQLLGAVVERIKREGSSA